MRDELMRLRATTDRLVECDDSRRANVQKFFASQSNFNSTASRLEVDNCVVIAQITCRRVRNVESVFAERDGAHFRRRAAR
ncbi:hypothetical protein QMZ05_02800 [Bradyrhizobium sp. INPA03-11B]|uniref:hypothetical protein n=1 Tax=Bradyrhizobium sp. INPA03-11B TaxID=418598 RepID=UPI00338E1556